MNKGIEILLARMDSNPDEFVTGNKSSKWLHIMERFEDHMTDEERKALFDKYNALKMDKFTEIVMKELFEEKEESGADAYASQLGASMAQTKHSLAQAALQQQYAQNQAAQLGSSITGLTGLALGAGNGPYWANTAAQNAVCATTTTTSTAEIKPAELTASKSLIKQIKKALAK